MAALVQAKRQTAHFRSFVLKMHARCNLRCDYCYMFAMSDQTWRSRPHVISRETIDRSAFRIAEHVNAHGIPSVDIILHGGEPLLAGPETIAYAVRSIRTALTSDTTAHFSVQTNGLLLDHQFIDLLNRLDVHVGLSLDGDATANDRHRRHADGMGSYAATAAAAGRLADHHPRLFSGFLSVIDLRNDPVHVYESLLRFSPPAIDFLLPHGNWSAPPPGWPADEKTAPYAEWLARLFDHWYGADRKETSIRVFDEIINLILGGSSAVEGLGLSPVAVAVVESDGEIERSDLLRSAYPAAGTTGLDVATHPFDQALPNLTTVTSGAGAVSLAPRCRRCQVLAVCGGGLQAHRYKAGHGFDNPSVYCADLYRLITYIQDRVLADLGRLQLGSWPA